MKSNRSNENKTMLQEKFVIKNEIGLHARPAAMFVDTTSKFDSEIKICYEDTEANAKSIISVLSLGLGKGDKFVIKIKGEDEKKAMSELESFIENKLGKKGNVDDDIIR
ncbi:MAG: HPr family phosphocarrier protein [Bacillota bacterium]